MDKEQKTVNKRPLFAFTAAAGIFPGASDINAFWDKIVKAETASLSPLNDRWGLKRDVYFAPEPGTPNKIYLDKAFCLPKKNNFSHPEKKNSAGAQIDYGKDVLKKLATELSNGGDTPSFSRTALVAGTSWSDQGYYFNDIDFCFNRKKEFEERFSPDEQLNQLAESLGVGGPVIAVDTACASSLYAVEKAVNLIRSGQAESAVILGLSVVLPPFLMSAFSQLMALSPEGECLPFSKDASGMVPGEAAAAVFLEPMEDAVASGRKILGVLCSTGLSSDGAEGSVFAPGASGQMNVYERAYRNIDPSGVDYIEAHGTATALGDETELQVINSFFGPHFKEGEKLYVGSVKSLLGHSLAAAGMSSLIKALFMLKNKTIPPHIDVVPNPVIEKSCIELAGKPILLDTVKRPVRIGVSSFGFGGSNVHIVLESYDERIHKPLKDKDRDKTLFPDIAIVDFEAGFGDKLSASELPIDFYINGSPDIFPLNRFNGKINKSVHGQFFPDKFDIDAKGLRLGPRFLSRIDAYQNHTVHLANNLLKRNPQVKGSETAAVAMSLNSGGAKTFKVARKYYADYYLDPDMVERDKIPDTTLEDIASGLGSMFSGYPAYHFDMKGFHQTFSGGTASFWTTMLTAPIMIETHCRELIAGAGNFIKTPVDLFDKRITGKLNAPVLEGSALFLLKSIRHAKDDGDHILASISAIVPSSIADSFEKACETANVDPEHIDIREFSQLNPESDYKQENYPRFAGEATGCEVLTSILLKDGNQASIEVYDGKKLRFTMFIKKYRKFISEKSQMLMPVTLPVSDALTYLKKKSEETRVAPEETRPFRDDNQDPMEVFRLWHKTTGATVQRFLKSQEMTASLKYDMKHKAGKKKPIALRNADYSVLSDISRIEPLGGGVINQGMFSATLIVDELHPYFFDHPLDHVPGILILQGALELFDVAQKIYPNNMFISNIEIEFKKMCEKIMPVYLTVSVIQEEPETPLTFICKAVQNSNVAAVIKLETKINEINEVPQGKSITHKPEPYPDPAVLHKHKAENVLVSDYIKKDEEFLFDLIPPPEDHVLGCDYRGMCSMLYILEVTRQCGMIIVHKVENVPLKTPMILLSLKFNFDRPAYCHTHLKISHMPTNETPSGKTIMGAINFSFHDSDGVLGTSSISALIAK